MIAVIFFNSIYPCSGLSRSSFYILVQLLLSSEEHAFDPDLESYCDEYHTAQHGCLACKAHAESPAYMETGDTYKQSHYTDDC